MRQVRHRVAERLTEQNRRHEQATGATLHDTTRTALVLKLIDDALDEATAERIQIGQRVLRPKEESRVRHKVRNSLLGAGGLQPLLEDASIEDIAANGHDQVHVRRIDGHWESAAPIADSDAEMVELIRTLAARSGEQERRWDRASPVLDLQLPDGSRLNAAMAVARRPSLSIRRHHYLRVTLAQLEQRGTLDTGLRELLGSAVRGRLNIVVSGSTGAGKTTLLRALGSAIPVEERLVTIEDSYELAFDRDAAAHPNVVALQARDANVEGEGAITMGQLFRTALRMAPDRIIVGEVRGDEVLPMLNAMSQGNDGSLSTLHARSSEGVFAKLATYAIQTPQQVPHDATALLISESVDLVVQLAHLGGHQRAVVSVREVIDADGIRVSSNEIYRPGPDGRAVPTGSLSTQRARRLEAHGLDLGLLQNRAGWWQPLRRTT